MKKFLGILAVAGVLVACDNAADTEKRTKDSLDSVRVADSLRNLTPMPSIDTMPKMHTDSMSKMSSDSVR